MTNMRVSLINMPFAYLRIPSIAITQLKSVLDGTYGDRVQTELHYFNMDLAQYLGLASYDLMASNMSSRSCNFGEWYFRQEAFPDLKDNSKQYFDYYHLNFDDFFLPLVQKEKGRESIWPPLGRGKELIFYAETLMEKRPGLKKFLEDLVIENRLHEATVVGFTSMFQQNTPSFALARKIKEVNPEVIIVMGGANCESPMGEEIVRNIDTIDYVFSGNGLISFPEFIGYILEGEYEKCQKIDGVFTRTNLANIGSSDTLHEPSTNGQRIQVLGKELPINEIVELDYDSYLEDLSGKMKGADVNPTLLFETSRGCWWGAKAHCTFCGLNGSTMGYRAMDPDIAVPVLSKFFERYRDRAKKYSSVDNIMPKSYLDSVFPKLEIPEDLSIFYEVKADLKPDDLKVMADTQIRMIQPGIESLSTGTLKLMRKGVTAIGNVYFLINSIKYNIHAFWNLLIGFPGESEEAYIYYLENLESFYHLTPPHSLYIVRFDRYSPYQMQASQYGLDLVPMKFNDFIYPEIMSESLVNMAYFFEDKNEEAEYMKLTRKWYYPISDVISQWIARYNLEDGKEPPRLYFEDRRSVYDSRLGEVEYHSLTDAQHNLLDFFGEPKNAGQVHQYLRNGSGATSEDLDFLIDKKLVFHENERSYLSLVFENLEATSRFEKSYRQ